MKLLRPMLMAAWLALVGVSLAAALWKPPGFVRETSPRRSLLRVVVLVYHDVRPVLETRGASITTRDFGRQLRFLLDFGWRPLSFADFTAWLEGEKRLEGRWFLLTFDDGYESQYRYAYPFLLRLAVPAVYFPIAAYADGKRSGSPPHLSPAQIMAMAKGGLATFGSHTYDLHFLDGAESALVTRPTAAVFEDLRRSKTVLEVITGQPVVAFAYPYGEVAAQGELKASGYRYAFALGNRDVQKEENDLLEIPRYTPEIFSWEQFTSVFGR